VCQSRRWHKQLPVAAVSQNSKRTTPVGHQKAALPPRGRGHFLTIFRLADLTAVEPHALIDAAAGWHPGSTAFRVTSRFCKEFSHIFIFLYYPADTCVVPGL